MSDWTGYKVTFLATGKVTYVKTFDEASSIAEGAWVQIELTTDTWEK